MKAITYRKYGPPEVLQVETVADPALADDELLIRVRAAEATKADCEMRSFDFSVKWFWLPLRLAVGVFRPRRRILGGYFAGDVVAVGSEVRDYAVGDAVFGSTGLGMGTYGEYLAIKATQAIAPKPRNMTYAEAAAVPLGGLNALHFMRLARIQVGERVLINGAGGSIGAHAIQIAKSMGAIVIAVDGSHKEELITRLGADVFVDYTREKFTDRGESYDVIFDMVPKSAYSACIAALNPGGRYLAGNPRLSVMLRSVFTTRFSDKSARFAFAAETQDELVTLAAMIEDESIVSIVDTVVPMQQAADAHRRVETEQRCGAIVISMDSSTSEEQQAG